MKAKYIPKILFFGPVPPPVFGEAVAFFEAYRCYNGKKRLINKNSTTKAPIIKAIQTLLNIIQIYYNCFIGRFNLGYFSCSRSLLGSLRDIFFIEICSAFGLILVVHLHGSDFNSFILTSKGLHRRMLLRAYGKVSYGFVLLDEMKSQFSDFQNIHTLVIPNFVDPGLPLKEDFSRKNDVVRLIFFSNLMFSKGLFDVLESFIILSLAHNNLELHIAGKIMSDSYKSKEEVAAFLDIKLGESESITYHGMLSGSEKNEFLLNGDLFILPSFKEGVPLSLLEAMVTGNVIIASDCNYLRYLFSHDIGQMVALGDIGDLVNAISLYINDHNLMVQTQISNGKLAKRKYSKNNYINNLESAFIKIHEG